MNPGRYFIPNYIPSYSIPMRNMGMFQRLDLFSNIDNVLNNEKEKIDQKEENKLQHALLDIKKKYGKNARNSFLRYPQSLRRSRATMIS